MTSLVDRVSTSTPAGDVTSNGDGLLLLVSAVVRNTVLLSWKLPNVVLNTLPTTTFLLPKPVVWDEVLLVLVLSDVVRETLLAGILFIFKSSVPDRIWNVLRLYSAGVVTGNSYFDGIVIT